MSTPDFSTLVRELLGEDGPPPAPSATDTRILDGALCVVGEVGERRLTIDDVAAAARVARATIFRRFGSKDALIARMYAREIRVTIDSVSRASAPAPDAAGALAAGFADLLRSCLEHPVIQQLSRADPDIMVTLWRDGSPAGITLVRALLDSLVRDRPRAETGDGAALAAACDTLARLLFSCLLIPAGDGGEWLTPDRRERAADDLVRRLLPARSASQRSVSAGGPR